MRGEEFTDLYYNEPELKKWIIERAMSRANGNIEQAEEYVQDAWLRISQQEAGQNIDTYKEDAEKAIWAGYQRWYYKRNIRAGKRKYIKKKYPTRLEE